MSSKIEGVSAETVKTMQNAMIKVCESWDENGTYIEGHTDEFLQAAITALLASGEVVLRKEAEELVAHGVVASKTMRQAEQLIASTGLHNEWHESGKQHGAFHDLLFKRIRLDETLAKFTTKPTIGEQA